MRPALAILCGLAVAILLGLKAGYLELHLPQGAKPTGDFAVSSAASAAPAIGEDGSEALVAQAEPAAPVRPAAPTAANPATKVDETALRYFAAKGDTKRLEAEIARLRALYPQWTPPENPLAVQEQGDAKLDAMWKLYSDGKLAELRKAIADRQTAEPNWQVPSDLLDRVAVAEAREQLVNASDLKQYDAVIRLGSTNPSLLTCGDVDVMWRVAEAFAQTDRKDRARDAYLYVLKNCDKPEERLATIQKAGPLLPRADIDALLATERKTADGKGEFEPIRGELARQALVAADADETLTVSEDDIARVEALAKDNKTASDDLLVGWYRVRRDKPEEAEKWFRQAQAKQDDASAAQGLALALVQQGRHAEAEETLAKWRDTSEEVRSVYLAAVANLLAGSPPPDIRDEVLQRMVATVVEAKDAASAQQFGWYADALNQFQTAEQWFTTALSWKPDDEPSAYGLALMRWKMGDMAGVRQVQTAWAGRSERIPTVGEPSIETSALENRMRTRQVRPDRQAPVEIQRPVAPETAPRDSASVYGSPQESDEPAPRAAARRQTTSRNTGCSTAINPATLSPQAALNRGWCLMEADRPVEAAAAFEVALRGTGQTKRDAAYGQSLAYIRAGLTDKAAVSATQAPIDATRSAELRTALLSDQALSSFRKGRYAETLIALDEHDRISPARNDLMVLRGYAYLRLGRLGDAEKVFKAVAATGNRDALKGLADVAETRRPVGAQ